MTPFDPIRYKEIERKVYSRTAESYAKYGASIFESMAFPLLKGAKLKLGQRMLDVAKQIEDQAKAEAEKYRVGEKLRIPCEVVIAWAKKAD